MKSVVSIEYSEEEKDVYDLTVEEDHSYIANNTMSHNSALSLNMAMHQAKWGARVGLLSLEMNKEELALRQAAYLGDIDMGRILRKELTEKEKKHIMQERKEFNNILKKKNGCLNLIVPDADITNDEALFLMKPYGYDIIYIDYVGLLKDADADDQWKKLGSMTRTGKRFAENTNSVVAYCAQLSADGIVRYSRTMQEHCVTGDAEVYIDGSLLTVKDLAKKYSPTKNGVSLNCNIFTSTGDRKVKKFYSFGKKEVCRIKTLGNSIGVSITTPVLVLDISNYSLKWVKACNLDINTHMMIQSRACKNKSCKELSLKRFIPKIPCDNRQGYCKFPKYLTLNFARLIGYWHSDGSISSPYIHFCNQNINVVKDYVKMFYSCFNVKPKVSWNKSSNTYEVRIYRKSIYQFLKNMDIVGTSYTKNARILLKCPIDTQLEYLTGILQGDGYSRKNCGPNVRISLCSRYVIKCMGSILNGIGSIYSFKKILDSKNNKMWELNCPEAGSKNIKKMCNNLNKLNPLKWGYVFDKEVHYAHSSFGVIPGFNTHMKKYKKGTRNRIFDKNGNKLPTGMGLSLAGSCGFANLPIKKIKLQSPFFQMLKRYFKNEYKTVKYLKKYNLEPVKIENIKRTFEKVYDFTVDQSSLPILGEGNFIANNLVIHNSNNVFAWIYDQEAKDSGIIEVQQLKARNQNAFNFSLRADFSRMKFKSVAAGELKKKSNSNSTPDVEELDD